ncbi:hypothetical protein Cri9333_1915 [Crinalium epipsammum PCC 9333]|uniref:Uncharacterized protein n=1 Tax=Crinalium epipsammum PCC 9333 TaxID=1173022 RepID=K9VZ73_9CYAN|nr:hypothetical protein [Crinalium epipsammum]AFZ12797.1 hypothetical protein Cri9333_1915 [Crinalium epipsammum PCC 9333]
MAASDDFKEQLKAGKIVEALALALSEAIELQVTTWVSSDQETDIKPGQRLRTRINLLEGDIENEIGKQFIGNSPYRELRDFHRDQVNQGQKIIQDNLNSLQKLFELWVRLRYPNANLPQINVDLPTGESQRLPSPQPNVTTRPVGIPPTPVAQAEILTPELFPEPSVAQAEISTPELFPEPSVAQAEISTPEPAEATPTIEDETTPSMLPSESDLEQDWQSILAQPSTTTPLTSQEQPEAADIELSPSLEQITNVTTVRPPRLDSLQLGTQENIDSSVLEQINSLPTVRPPSLDALHLGTQEGEENLLEPHNELDITPPQPTSETLPEETDPALDDWVLQHLEQDITSNNANQTTSNQEFVEEWDDWTEEENELITADATQLDVLEQEFEEEWDNWVDDEANFANTNVLIPDLNTLVEAEWEQFKPDFTEVSPVVVETPQEVEPANDDWVNHPELVEEWEADKLAESHLVEEFERLSPEPEVSEFARYLSEGTPTTEITESEGDSFIIPADVDDPPLSNMELAAEMQSSPLLTNQNNSENDIQGA